MDSRIMAVWKAASAANIRVRVAKDPFRLDVYALGEEGQMRTLQAVLGGDIGYSTPQRRYYLKLPKE